MPTALDRIFEVTGCKTQSELARRFGIRQSAISDAKKRGAVPAEWLIKLLQTGGINPDWILTGEGERYLEPAGHSRDADQAVKIKIEVIFPDNMPIPELLGELLGRFAGKRERP